MFPFKFNDDNLTRSNAQIYAKNHAVFNSNSIVDIPVSITTKNTITNGQCLVYNTSLKQWIPGNAGGGGGGSVTTNFIPKSISGNLVDSIIEEISGNVGVGKVPGYKFDVSGITNTNTSYYVNGVNCLTDTAIFPSQTEIKIGYLAAGLGTQGLDSVAIGNLAGGLGQKFSSVAIGVEAGAVNQATESVAIGTSAGSDTQGTNSVAIGTSAGNVTQGDYSVAIGTYAGSTNQGDYSVAIGNNAGILNQNNNTIIINANSTNLNSVRSYAFYVSPVHVADSGNTHNILLYDSVSKEIVTSSASSGPNKTFIIDHPLEKEKYLIHACLEGPESGVYYRGEGEIVNGEKSTIELPLYTSNFYDFTIQVTVIDEENDEFPNLKCSEIFDSKFTVSSNVRDCKFFWHVHGKRGDIDVEPLKNSIVVGGDLDSPYRFVKT